MSLKTNLINDKSYFTSQNIKFESNFYGIKKDSLELNIWVYEIICQIQNISPGNFVLKGGGASQLYLPLDYQRCTVDVDMLCSDNENEIINTLNQIQHNFTRHELNCSFEKYVPKMQFDKFHVIPMVTYLIYLPFRFQKHRRSDLKIDFLYGNTSELEVTPIDNPSVLGLNINYSPVCISKNTLISEKLLTFASNSIGLQEYKVDGLYKNLYDLYHLINIDASLDSFKKVSHKIFKSIDFECSLKKLSTLSTDDILDDMLMTLFNLFTWDLKTKETSLHRKVKRFMESSLQRNIRQSLTIDMWAIMAMNTYVYLYSITNYIKNSSLKDLSIINEYIEQSSMYNNLSKSQKKEFKVHLYEGLMMWKDDIIIDNSINIDRLIFLYILIDNKLI